MAKKVITGKSAKATVKARKATTNKDGSRKVAKMPNPVKGRKVTVTAVKKTGARVTRQHVAVGSLELQYEDRTYGKVYVFSPKLGDRYQLQQQKTEVVVCKFSPSGRKYRYVGTERTLQGAVKRIKAGAYNKFFS